MACRGVLFAITADETAKLLAARSDEEVRDIVQLEIEERWDEEWLTELDKAGDVIHRSLTDGSLVLSRGRSPLAFCILAGSSLGATTILSLSRPRSKLRRSRRLSELLVKTASANDNFKIDKEDYGCEISEDDFEYTWEYFKDLPDFYANAAEAKRHMIFTVDQ